MEIIFLQDAVTLLLTYIHPHASRGIDKTKFCQFEQEIGQGTYDDTALNPHILLLEQPDLDARFLHQIRIKSVGANHQQPEKEEPETLICHNRTLTLWRNRKMRFCRRAPRIRRPSQKRGTNAS
jgi:hypothetical protein